MFDKILIANRGEIACRIIKTAHALGVDTVAVYTEVDAQALHVRRAGEAVHIGPAPVTDSYLCGDKIIAAALQTAAQAIHPGYGFLSENPDFVDAVTEAGLVFIGPSAKAIRAMGLKDAAKVLMEKAGVPVVPGYHGAKQDAAFLSEKAQEIGYPVLIKAVAGGGGKGMRLVNSATDFPESLEAAQSEARNAFGNADVLIEKYIASPRHIEVQVFGDGTDAVHLFERDCSLQRRHQKVIEEAPAPGMTDVMRKAMGDAAVKAAKAIGYAGAGTVEFIVDGSDGLHPDRFWFMEMNTRLQVEHPVTEAVTGIDLVDWQLRVAAGAGLPCGQDAIVLNGHAFEARLYTEDVPAGFLPATGRISHLEFARDARVDSGVQAGDTITPWYDPMIAKVVVHGADRDAALRRFRAALDACRIAGVVTNLGFLRRLVRDHGFASGRVDTGLIARAGRALTDDPAPTVHEIAIAAVALARLPTGAFAGFALWEPLIHVITLSQGDAQYAVHLTVRRSDQCTVFVAGEQVVLTNNGDHWGAPAILDGNAVTVAMQRFQAIDPLARKSDRGGGDLVLAPMPGMLRAVNVQAGQSVRAGDRLCVLEAMKMEHALRAPRDGVVAKVNVQTGEQVTAQSVLMALEPQA